MSVRMRCLMAESSDNVGSTLCLMNNSVNSCSKLGESDVDLRNTN